MNLKTSVIWTAVVVSALFVASPSQAADDDLLPASFLANAKIYHVPGSSIGAGGGVLGRRSTGSLLGIDSIPNWSSYFYYPGVDSNGNLQFTWTYTMVGKSPFGGGDGGEDGHGSSTINAPVVPVTMDLRNYDGSPRFINGKPLISSPSAFVQPVLDSPIFQKTHYDSSEDPTQFTDAIQKAEFPNADDNWHTKLSPAVKTGRTMVLRRGTYAFSLNADGTCCRFILVDINAFGNALFPPGPGDTTTPMGQAETAGDVRTTDLSTFLFPNTFLFFGTTTNCCVIGFHTYDLEPGDAKNGWRERRYVTNYSSWVSPGLFGASFADITPLSHELAETFNDPFVNNATPWWLAPNGNCQNNLETGDVIEGLPFATYPITLKGVTYHPQNEALLQWFAGQTPSSAIGHAYSYPDKTILTTASKSQKYGCAP
jgi:hypothetical protein